MLMGAVICHLQTRAASLRVLRDHDGAQLAVTFRKGRIHSYRCFMGVGGRFRGLVLWKRGLGCT